MRGELAEKRDFKGVWIPKEIWLNKKLSIMEKLFLVEIDSLDNENHCFASNSYFSKFFNLGITRTSQIINSLIKKGFISAQYERKGNEIVKRVLIVICKNLFNKVYEGIQKSVRRYPEKCKENNTSNNTSNKRKEDSPSFVLATLLFDLIMIYTNPTRYVNNKPDLLKWAEDIEKLIRIDKVTYKKVKEVIEWCTANSFWGANIMSGKKLREKYNTLEAQMIREDKNKPFDCTEVIKNLK